MRVSFAKLISIPALLLVLGFAVPVQAQILDPCKNINSSDSLICNTTGNNGSGLFGPNSIWNNLLNMLTYIVGAIAVLMIIIGGIRYALSSGDQSNITAAKNTILYAVIALIVAVMANAIVNFVLTTI